MKVKDIITKARACKKSVEKLQKIGIGNDSAYYFCKVILGEKTNVKDLKIKNPSNPSGDYISRQVKKADYVNAARRLVEYVELHKQMPNYLTVGKFKLEHKVYTYLYASALVTSVDTAYLPKEVNVSSKLFVSKTEPSDKVYEYYVKKTGRKPKTIDEVLTFMIGKGYGGYYDDKLSNFQVIDSLVNPSKPDPNCVDALQFLINMGKKLDYECKCIHVKCRQSGTGHVFGKFRHKVHTGNSWIIRDPAAVVDGGNVRKVWCSDGYVLAEDPGWFEQNLNR